jgi:predicted mannosyl-3-phosphoglycerate phosphatase (HAD superfamily)
MPRNIISDSRPTVFLDIDGTIVKHNYNPEIYDDIFVKGAEEVLRELQEKNYLIILVTSRIQKHCERLLEVLARKRIFVTLISDLPTGRRILINDKKYNEDKAIAINVKRDGGFDGEAIKKLFAQ